MQRAVAHAAFATALFAGVCCAAEPDGASLAKLHNCTLCHEHVSVGAGGAYRMPIAPAWDDIREIGRAHV